MNECRPEDTKHFLDKFGDDVSKQNLPSTNDTNKSVDFHKQPFSLVNHRKSPMEISIDGVVDDNVPAPKTQKKQFKPQTISKRLPNEQSNRRLAQSNPTKAQAQLYADVGELVAIQSNQSPPNSPTKRLSDIKTQQDAKKLKTENGAIPLLDLNEDIPNEKENEKENTFDEQHNSNSMIPGEQAKQPKVICLDSSHEAVENLDTQSQRRYETRRVTNAKLENAPIRLFVYPVTADPKKNIGAVAITSQDVDVLKPGEFLNDTVIEFYLKWIYENVVKARLDHQDFYFFNTFFYKKLSDKSGGYSKVAKWTKGVDIFSKKYIFIPINEKSHWYLAVVCFNSIIPAQKSSLSKHKNVRNIPKIETVTAELEAQTEKEQGVCSQQMKSVVLVLDSLGQRHTNVFKLIRKYLASEWDSRKGSRDPRWGRDEIVGTETKPPQQNNYSDCGIFLLHYVEMFCRNPPKRVDEINDNWFPIKEIEDKRQEINSLIERYTAEYQALNDNTDPDIDEIEVHSDPTKRTTTANSNNNPTDDIFFEDTDIPYSEQSKQEDSSVYFDEKVNPGWLRYEGSQMDLNEDET
eukprot:CAMPEP_0168545664 /NCGR_PEP_ID=MMETSP0413-20121227/3080_1 /TAXON_ID=136452 /ORGANISM="Filamoeba nolandi, Strain NC-AS-23-1" /LENGTH=575 /DNA_ID=CAMNT_0008575779 /DNA_START=36 /DNA_END=1763 /DNA_ORIENTATION=-